MIRIEESGLLKGLIVCRDRRVVYNLRMNTIFFFKTSLENIQNLKLILLVFGQILRLKFNLEKKTLFSINLSQDMISKLALMLDCKVLEWLLSYLGLLLGENLKANRFGIQWLIESRGDWMGGKKFCCHWGLGGENKPNPVLFTSHP